MLPTAVFFPADRSAMKIGSAATEALIAGEDGRFMRAMKSALGTSLFHEQRLIGGKRRSLSQIVTAFLTEVKLRAEAEAGQVFDRVLSGRPVHFHSLDSARDAQAEVDLVGCYRAAGFGEVGFLFEPVAAARASQDQTATGQLGLIVDIGGGTSDYSVFRRDGSHLTILASHGIRLGGTDFDRMLSMTHAMPWLGLGGVLRREMGAGLLPVPRHIYLDLATWAKIHFLYTPETRAAVTEMVKLATKPRLMRRLAHVLQSEPGHDLAFAVEAGKIAANRAQDGAFIDMGRIEGGLSVPISHASSDRALQRYRHALGEAATEACRMAGVATTDIATLVLVGGSSLMSIVSNELVARFPKAEQRSSDPFYAVLDGLALASQEAVFS